MIWLVDYTHYRKTIDPRLAAAKQVYFRIKNYVRAQKIGYTAPVRTRVFATGLLRLATLLHKNGIEVRYLHYYNLEKLLANGEPIPSRVAFSAICPTVPLCAALAKTIKDRSPSTHVLIGGVHVNLNPHTTHELFPIFDELSVGYEKEAAEKIAGHSLQDIPAPYVDYTLLPYSLKEYAINTFTSMGCPFQCDYCADGRAPHFCAALDGQVSVMKELLPQKTLIHFFDSVLGYNQEGLLQTCTALKKTRHNFLLSCDMRADMVTPASLSAMEEAGFVEVRLGMESADTDLLKRNQRTLTVDRFEEQIRMIRKHSLLYITLYSITGLPGTTTQSTKRTLDYCHTLFAEGLVDEIKNCLYVPYPMEGVDYSTRGITVFNSDWTCYDRQSFPVFYTDDMSAQELWEMYLDTAEAINQSWLSGLGFASVEDVPIFPGYYREYVEENYLKEMDITGSHT